MSSSIPQLKDGEQTVYFQAGGEWCFLKTPASYQAEGAGTPCVIQCHGHHGYVKDGEADWLTEDFKLSFVNSLIDSGIAVASTNATGNHWGRPSAVAANGALFDSLVEGSNVDASRMGLWGGGLGGALLWNSVTGPLLGRLRAVCLQQATISYDSVIRNHKFKSFLLEAYGLPADTPDDLAVAALAFNDPVTRTRSVDWGERAEPWPANSRKCSSSTATWTRICCTRRIRCGCQAFWGRWARNTPSTPSRAWATPPTSWEKPPQQY